MPYVYYVEAAKRGEAPDEDVVVFASADFEDDWEEGWEPEESEEGGEGQGGD